MVENGQNENEHRDRSLTSAIVVAGLLVVAGVVVYFWRLFPHAATLPQYAAAGDAMSPLVGVATAGALLAALWSVKLQREELRLQRKEMKESRMELARAADAQLELAGSQRDLADAQSRANRVSISTGLAQIQTIIVTRSDQYTTEEQRAARTRLNDIVSVLENLASQEGYAVSRFEEERARQETAR